VGTVIFVLLTTLAGVIALPAAMLLVEVVAAVIGPETVLPPPARAPSPRLGVLVPAHNEGEALLPTVADIRRQLHSGDRLLIVADNCSDDTAATAAAAGAEVIERNDRARIGKGYALDRGIAHLTGYPPDIVVMIDADCRLADGVLTRLASVCSVTCRPVQALYVMTAPEESAINFRVAEFAWRVRNWVRPLGLSALDLPCQLMGTGMAFPWNVIRSADFTQGSIVEDLRLGIDLTLAGTPPIFCPSAVVSSRFPATVRGAETQRARWEQGHLAMIVAATPQLLYAAISRGNLGALALALDLAVPPLSFFAVLLAAMASVTGLAALLGGLSMPFIISVGNAVGFGTAVILAWWKFGRDILPAKALASVPGYVWKKLPLYFQAISGKSNTNWVRTDRNPPPNEG
jgi:cellulose synthase/poly-beta-1,6-N-acetylglucosamine synthase-like glycosyltransferase